MAGGNDAMTRVLRISILVTLLIAVSWTFICLVHSPARAQFLPGSNASKSSDETSGGLGAVLEGARKDGSTVIIVKPGGDNRAGVETDERAAQSARFFNARSRVQDIVVYDV